MTDPATLDRIRGLVIPPAWQEVWICCDDRGHIQARGIDIKGRRQYLYHQRWRERQERAKFDHMLMFARALPGLRGRVARDIASGEDLDRDRVLACSVRLLDLGFFRIGGESYAEENQHYGLATILKSHVQLGEGDRLVFDFVAKGGKRRVASVVDKDVFGIVEALKRRRGGGPELLAYRRGKRWADVQSTDINAYIKEATGGEFTAKDFRTWNATVLASVALAVSTDVASEHARRRAVTRAVREVASYMGNTPTVARSAYIDPRVIDRYNNGETIRDAVEAAADSPASDASHLGETIEAAVIDLIAQTLD